MESAGSLRPSHSNGKYPISTDNAGQGEKAWVQGHYIRFYLATNFSPKWNKIWNGEPGYEVDHQSRNAFPPTQPLLAQRCTNTAWL